MTEDSDFFINLEKNVKELKANHLSQKLADKKLAQAVDLNKFRYFLNRMEIVNHQMLNKLHLSDTWREKQLLNLENGIKELQEEIVNALAEDFRCNPLNARLLEMMPILDELEHTKSSFCYWIKERVGSPLKLLGAESFIYYEPHGVCLIVGCWEMPFFGVMKPLISAIAAGNFAVVVLPEKSSKTNSVLHKLFETYMDKTKFILIDPKSVPITEIPEKVRFDFIYCMRDFETCQTMLEIANKQKIGSVAFSQGKNVAVVEPSADINEVAEKVVWAKFLNSGQTLYAPDYVYVHERLYHDFLWKAKLQAERYWNDDRKGFFGGLLDTSRIKAVIDLLEDEATKNAELITTLKPDSENRTLEPVVIGSLDKDSAYMKQHPRAPVLPVLKYKDFNSLIQTLSREKNIQSIYHFSKNFLHQEDMLRKSKASNIYFNDIFFPTTNLDLPYSSPVPQTYGRLNGIYGFKTFSMGKTVFEAKKNFLFDYIKPPVRKEKYNIYSLISKVGRIRIFNVYIMGAIASYFTYKNIW